MSHFVRQSKFRHVFVNPPKSDQVFSGFRCVVVVARETDREEGE